jgi:YjbE family integral membrane protein
MEFLNELQTTVFWVGLWQIILVNIVLSGDNAVVIALAARSLPPRQQNQAIFWGAGAAVVMRIILTVIAVEMLKWPWLKLIGAVLLLWIAVKLLMPEHDGDENVDSSDNLLAAIKTILVADLVMSLDNVIAVAAAAKGSLTLLILGLAISIPLVIFGSTLLLKLMTRWPVIITIGAALLGWVAGDMAATDPTIKDWVDANAAWLHWAAPAVGAVFVVALGKWLGARPAHEAEPMVDMAGPTGAAEGAHQVTGLKLLVAVDGSGHSSRAVERAINEIRRYKEVAEVYLVNVQHPLPASAAEQAGPHRVQELHREEGLKALAEARKRLDAAGVKYHYHIGVGDAAEIIAGYVREKGCDEVVMGTRGHGTVSNMLLGSVAIQVIEHSPVPVLLVK